MQKKYIGGLVFLVVVVALVVSVGLTIHAVTNANTNGHSTGGQQVGQRRYSVVENVFPVDPCTDPTFIKAHPDIAHQDTACQNSSNQTWVNYSLTDIVVGANSLVTVTIVNYTRPNGLINTFWQQPQGVVGDAISVNGKQEKSVSPSMISHTFAIHGIASSSQPWLFVSVPVTEADLSAGFDAHGIALKPTVTIFQFHTLGKGHYIWFCQAHCGTQTTHTGGPMSTKGYMSGTFTVV